MSKSVSAESPPFQDDKNVYCGFNNNLHAKDKGYMGYINGQRELKLSKLQFGNLPVESSIPLFLEVAHYK